MNLFWYVSKLSSFFKMKHKIYKEYVQMFIYSTMIFLKMWFSEETLNIFHNKLQQISFKFSILWKNLMLEKNDMQSNYKIMFVVFFNVFWPFYIFISSQFFSSILTISSKILFLKPKVSLQKIMVFLFN